ncbi:MAG: phosphatidylglycerophosphatase A [Deltaproteobacteria bacterium]|nr:phosphatidylglycerophosphatase A [Deltaproteobacteria bacterium]
MPGTAATALAIPLSWLLNQIAALSIPLSLLALGSFFGAACWLCKKGEEIFQQKDCQRIVIDEIAGFLLANFLAPAGLVPTLTAFFFFRIFDIIKVFPANLAERLEGWAGVILDDVIAGLYAFVMLRFLEHWRLL